MQPNKIYNHRTLSKMIGYGYTRAVRDGVPIKARAFVSMMNGFIEWVFGDGGAKDVVTVEGLKWNFDKQRGMYKAQGCGVVYQIDDWEDIGVSYWIGESDTVGNEAVSVEQAKQACQDHYEAQVLALIKPLCMQPNSLDNV